MPGSYPTMDREWQAKDDLRTLQQAEEIKEDPNRMAAAKQCATEQMEAAQKALGIKGAEGSDAVKQGYTKL